MKDNYPAWNLKDVLMKINWVKLQNSWEVMAGQRGQSEQVIAKSVKAAAKIQSCWYQKFNFDCIQENESYIMSTDGMHCRTDEFQLNPIAKWYSQKNTSGLTMPSIMIDFYGSEVLFQLVR